MKLTFKPSRFSDRQASSSRWNGVIVLLPSGEVGEQEVMFYRVSNNGKTLFARLVTDAVYKVESKGFYTSGSMCTTDACYRDNDGTHQYFTPGLLNPYLYSSDSYSTKHDNCVAKPMLGGTFYVGIHKNREVCMGLEDPSMFRDFLHYNEIYKAYKMKYQFLIGTHITVFYQYQWIDVKVIKCLSWKEAIVREHTTGREFQVDIYNRRVNG